MNITKGKLKKGGKLLAKGSYGCVYKPALKCEGSTKRMDGYVSKLMFNKDANAEIDEQKHIDKLDPEYHFHLKIGYACVPEKPDKKTDDLLRGCKLHGEELHSYYNKSKLQDYFLNVHIEDGGVGLSDYLEEKNVLDSVEKCEMMLFDFTRLIYGLDQFHKNGMGHFDLKTDNIVYNKDTNRFNFIDFGFSGIYSDFLQNNKSWGINYWVNPIERVFVNLDRTDVLNFYNELFKVAESDIDIDDLDTFMNDPIKSALIKNLMSRSGELFSDVYKHTFRDEFSKSYTTASHFVYGPYGVNLAGMPSYEMLFDYVEEVRTLTKAGRSPHEIMFDIQEKVLENIDTFSMSLAMIEMLHVFLRNTSINYKNNLIPVSYGDFYGIKGVGDNSKEIDEFYKNISSVSPIFGSFYMLLLKMNVPAYPKRISTRDAYDYYIKNIYTALLKKHSLDDLPFIGASILPEKQIRKNSSYETSSSETLPPENRTSSDTVIISSSKSSKSTTIKNKKKGSIKGVRTHKTNMTKNCKPTQVHNPLSGRCINKSGSLAIKLKKKGIIRESISSAKKTQRQVKPRNIKTCKENQVLNPLTGRCVNKLGRVAKKHKL